MNSGDWIENLTGLEYNNGQWSIYRYVDDLKAQAININKKKQAKESPKELMAVLLQELNVNTNKPGHLDNLPGNIEAA